MSSRAGPRNRPGRSLARLARQGIVRHLVAVDALIAFVRHHDPDRFLTALFAPPERRAALLALYAFNHELAHAREAAREPTLALIRLQWWREVVEGNPKHHEVATPLVAAMTAGALVRNDLLTLIDARETEAGGPIPTREAWRTYLRATAGGVAVSAARTLGAVAPETFRDLGAAYGAAGVLRSVPALAAQMRCLLPADVLAANGLSPEAVIAAPTAPGVQAVMQELAAEGRGMLLGANRRFPRAVVAAGLPAVFARRDLSRIECGRALPRQRGLGDRVAVTVAAARGRV
jgi:15-cis-phytoene synthase